jgi:dihydrofolate reductase
VAFRRAGESRPRERAPFGAADLIDEYLLMIHPLELGTGRRLFGDGVRASLRLTGSTTNTKGVLIATYEQDRDEDSGLTQ